MRHLIMAAAIAAATFASGGVSAQEPKPTVVLVHGAFADSSSWNGVVTRLRNNGYPVVAVANPLRSLTADADYLKQTLSNLNTSVVLVGHSYGGAVISQAASQSPNVRSLVYVGAFAPDLGENVIGLSGKYPGSTLGEALASPVELADGGKDLYIQQEKFHQQFAADVPVDEAGLMAATQRPISEAALTETATEAAWKNHPSWFVYGDADRNIPPEAMGWMAERAGSRNTVVVEGASHVVMISHPDKVADLIEEAAGSS
ncbi:alpha/beta fold hydrolase [Pseudochelatococcus sp. B33]